GSDARRDLVRVHVGAHRQGVGAGDDARDQVDIVLLDQLPRLAQRDGGVARALVLVGKDDPAVTGPATDLLKVELHPLADRVSQLRISAGRWQNGPNLEVGARWAARGRRGRAAAGGQGESAGRGDANLQEVTPGELVTQAVEEVALHVSAHRPLSFA